MDGRYSLDVLDVGANGDLIDVGANGIELATLTLEHGPLFRVPSLVFEPLFRCPTGPVRLPSLPSNDDSDEAREIREEFLHGNFGFSTDLDKTGFYKLSIPRGVHLSSEEMVAFNRVTLAFQQPCLNASFMEYHYKTSHHATKLLLAVKLFVLWSLFFADLARFGTQTPDTAHAVTAGGAFLAACTIVFVVNWAWVPPSWMNWSVSFYATAAVAVLIDLFLLVAPVMVSSEEALRGGAWMRAGLDFSPLGYMQYMEIIAVYNLPWKTASIVAFCFFLRSLLVWLAPILWLGTDAFAWLNASCLDNWTEGTRMRKPQEELPYDFLVLFYTLVGVWGTEKFLKVTHVEVLKTLVFRKRSAQLVQGLAPARKHSPVPNIEELDDVEGACVLVAEIEFGEQEAWMLGSGAALQVLTDLHQSFDRTCLFKKHSCQKLASFGDEYVCCVGLSAPATPEDARRLLDTGLALQGLVRRYAEKNNLDISLRVALHSGDASGGCVDVRAPRYALFGTDLMETTRAICRAADGLAYGVLISSSFHAQLRLGRAARLHACAARGASISSVVSGSLNLENGIASPHEPRSKRMASVSSVTSAGGVSVSASVQFEDGIATPHEPRSKVYPEDYKAQSPASDQLYRTLFGRSWVARAATFDKDKALVRTPSNTPSWTQAAEKVLPLKLVKPPHRRMLSKAERPSFFETLLVTAASSGASDAPNTFSPPFNFEDSLQPPAMGVLSTGGGHLQHAAAGGR